MNATSDGRIDIYTLDTYAIFFIYYKLHVNIIVAIKLHIRVGT